MNLVMLANIGYIEGRHPTVKRPKIKRDYARVVNGTTSSRIIKYLLKNGAASGTELRKNLEISGSPKAYIQPHIRANRVLMSAIHIHKSIYRINPKLKDGYFRFCGDSK